MLVFHCICFSQAFGLVACGTSRSFDDAFKDWAAKYSSSGFEISYYDHYGYLDGFGPQRLIITLDESNEHVQALLADKGKLIEEIKNARADFLSLKRAFSRRSKDASLSLRYSTHVDMFPSSPTLLARDAYILEIESDGQSIRNRLFLVGMSSDEVMSARASYETDFRGSPTASGTYEYELKVTNKNNRVPLRFQDFKLLHKRHGEVEWLPLDYGREYKTINLPKLVPPGGIAAYMFEVDGSYGRTGDLRIEYKAMIGWVGLD